MSNPRQSMEPLLPTSTNSNSDTTVHTPAESEEDRPTLPGSNMGATYSTAKLLAPAAFIFDFACQIYGMTSSPNMKDIHDKYPAAFSPQPFAIAAFFSPQQALQLLWLRELWRPQSQVEQGTLRYVPWYALGNACIGIWMFLWAANVMVTINTLTQVYYLFALRNKNAQTYQSKLTNVINITFAGIGVLDLFHNTSAAYFSGLPPNFLTKIFTMVGAPLTALVSPLLFGACIAYDLFGVAIGQHQLAAKAIGGMGGGGGESWARLLGGIGLGTAAIVGARAWGGARWV